MKKNLMIVLLALLTSATVMAEDHVMAATKGSQNDQKESPAVLQLSLKQAQDYAVESNRSLKNASLAVQEAYASRWQTIASMLPNVDLSYGYTNMCGYEMNFSGMNIEMPNYTTLSIQTSVGINGQGIVGALLQNVAIAMQKISLEQEETSLRASVMSSYVSVLTLMSITDLLDSSLVNLQELEEMTQRSVDVGAAEQTSADQIRVRVNSIKNNINSQKRSIALAMNSLKVLLDVPSTTQLVLTESLEDILSAERVLQLLGENFEINNNYNYQLLQQNTELARLNVHMAAWQYGPTISAYHQYSNQHYFQDGGLRMTPPNTVGVSLSMPLWSSGKRAAGVVEKKIAYEEAKNTLAETGDNLQIQNEQLRYNLENAYETYMNEKENLDVTLRVFESTTNKFKYGTSSNLELVNASNDVISAQSSFVQAVLSLANAQVELEKFLNNN